MLPFHSSSTSTSSYYQTTAPSQNKDNNYSIGSDRKNIPDLENNSAFVNNNNSKHADEHLNYPAHNQEYYHQHQRFSPPKSQPNNQTHKPGSYMSLPPPVTASIAKPTSSSMNYSPIGSSSTLEHPPNSQGSYRPQSYYHPSSAYSSSEYSTPHRDKNTVASASSSSASIASSSSMNSLASGGTFSSPALSHSQTYSSGLTAHQQQKTTMPPTASMNPYIAIPEEPTGSSALNYPHQPHKVNTHYRNQSLQINTSNMSPVLNLNAPGPNTTSAAALKRASYGSASSLMSFEDNSVLPYTASSLGSSQQISPNRHHFNQHSSPRLHNAASLPHSILDHGSNSAQVSSSSTTSGINSSTNAKPPGHSRTLSSSLSPTGSNMSMNTRPMAYGPSWVSPAVTPLSKTLTATVPGSVSTSANLKSPAVQATPKSATSTKQLNSPLFSSQQQQPTPGSLPPLMLRNETSPPKHSQTSSPQIHYQKSSRQNMSAQQSALMAATSQHRIANAALDLPQASDAYFRNSTGSHNTASAATMSSPSSSTSYYAPGAPPRLSQSSTTSIATTPSQLPPPVPPSLLQIAPVPLPPSFHRISSRSELSPIIHEQPKYRRALPEGGTLSPLAALTKQLSTTYNICNPDFNYQSSKNPRRILTKPSEGVHNNGYDNVDSDYILYVNDILGVEEKRRYLVLDVLGHGTFGQVAKCQNMATNEILAVKVIKSKPAYLKQSMLEVSILDHLNNQVDKNDEHNLLRFKDRFMHKNHLCLVFELLSSNLYELIKRNQFRGLSTGLVRVFAQQLLDSLKVLKDAKIIHCDLKPENILLRSLNSPIIKVIDFGSACHELQTVYTYIQSRFYRSPEVLLGLPYTSSIDMWSLGCIMAELFLGLPIFPGTSEYNQLSRITDTLGAPPNWMIEMGKASFQFMELKTDEYGRKRYVLKSRQKYSEEFQTKEEPSKQYFPSTNLDEIIMNYPLPRQRMSQQDIQKEMNNRESFLDFLKGLLNINPFERWTPHQAAMHPFITEKKYTGPFVPNLAMKNYREKPSVNTNPSNSIVAGTDVSQHSVPAGRSSYTKSQPPQPPSLPNNKDPQAKMYYGPTNSNTVTGSASGLSSSVYGTASTGKAPTHLGPRGHPVLQMPQPPPQSQVSAHSAQPVQQKPPQPLHNHHQQQFQHRAAAASSWTTRRPRASTIGNADPVPPPIQRATALVNPSQPIRTQDSPAYFPPPELVEGTRQHQPNNSSIYDNHVNVIAGSSLSPSSTSAGYHGGVPSQQQQQAYQPQSNPDMLKAQHQQPAKMPHHLAPSGLSQLTSAYGSLNGLGNGGTGMLPQQQLQQRQRNPAAGATQNESDIVRKLEQASAYWS